MVISVKPISNRFTVLQNSHFCKWSSGLVNEFKDLLKRKLHRIALILVMWEDGTVALNSNALLDTRCNIAINFKKVFGFVASILNLRASQLNLADTVRYEQHLSLANLNEQICKEDCRVEIVEVIASWYHG